MSWRITDINSTNLTVEDSSSGGYCTMPIYDMDNVSESDIRINGDTVTIRDSSGKTKQFELSGSYAREI